MSLPIKNVLSVLILASIIFSSCSQPDSKKEEFRIDITAFDYAFQAPDEIPSGWITFVLNNQKAHEIHELSFALIPDQITYREYLNEYVGAWEILLNEFQEGSVERAQISDRVDELLPPWADQIKYVNARGLVSPGKSAQRTVYLEPGKYALDCWVKNDEGIIHLSMGMTRRLMVTEESANSEEPSPESTLTLHRNKIETNWNPEVGKHSFALYMEADSSGESSHNNIHLIKFENEPNFTDINKWLDWYRVGGLRAPAPAEFLGGVSTYDADPGKQASYFTLDIEETGNYAWIVQVSGGPPVTKQFLID